MTILLNESNTKDSSLLKEKASHLQSQTNKDNLLLEYNLLSSQYKSKQSLVLNQNYEMIKLNTLITNLKVNITKLTESYQRHVLERNTIGLQLIDTNDELSLLYEKSTQLNDYYKSMILELNTKEDERKHIQLDIKEYQRQYHISNNRIMKLNNNELDIISLNKEINKNKVLIQEISSKLEKPTSNADGRLHLLDDINDPDEEQMNGKILLLQKRLDKQREVYYEKELIYHEINKMNILMKTNANEYKEEAKLLAIELSELQLKVNDISKKLYASVSELSMYQVCYLSIYLYYIYILY